MDAGSSMIGDALPGITGVRQILATIRAPTSPMRPSRAARQKRLARWKAQPTLPLAVKSG